MASQEHPLLSLAPEKQQQLVDLVESNDIESIANRTGLTRRQVLGIGAMLAGSGALGGFAASEVVDPAKAQADTGDSDGNVGLPTDRVDVFADGVDTNSLSTAELSVSNAQVQAALDGVVVPVGDGLGVKDAVDPANTTTPVQDALDVVANGPGNGAILLPTTTIVEEATINWPSAVSLRTAAGGNPPTIDMSTVTGTLIDFNGVSNAHFDPFALQGPGDGAASTTAVDFNTSMCSKLKFDYVEIRGVYGEAVAFRDVKHYQIDFGALFGNNVDGGDSAFIDIYGAGPNINLGHIWAYPSATTSASNSDVINMRDVAENSGNVTAESMNIGGSAGRAAIVAGGQAFEVEGQVNYEPNNHQSTPAAIVYDANTSVTPISMNGLIVVNGATVDTVYTVDGGGNNHLARHKPTNGSTINTNVVEVLSDYGNASYPNLYEGVSGEVTDSSGVTLTAGVSCIGDFTRVT